MHPRHRSGFSLVEVVLAAFVFAVGVLALEATAVSSLRSMTRSARLGLAASVAGSRLETLAATRCVDLRSGSDTIGSVVSSWTVEPGRLVGTRAVSQTVTYELDGLSRTDTYRSVVPCSP